MLFLCSILFVVTCNADDYAQRPNIILFLADDLGWNDVGYHGSNQIPTPNIDALAYSGVALHNYYVLPICTPSRAALMTGKYPIHTGMQHGVIYGAEPRGLPLSEKILPQYLKELGYATHLIGKWHLGSYKKEYLPYNRGFDSHTGFITGKIDMYDHTNVERGSWGFDFKRDSDALVSHDLFGVYATDIYTDEATKIIKAHNRSQPLFLMVAHSAVHSGNPYEPIRAPESVIEKFSYIKDRQRQKFAGVLTKLDESIGEVVSSLQSNGLLQNSIIIFSTDNGGAAAGFNSNAASNFPLRGVKNTLWEGGLRGAGALWSPLLTHKNRVATQLLHISDWLPTLYSAAGGNTSVFKNIDGIDQWEALSKDSKSERTTLLHNIDDIWKNGAITVDQWKVVTGTNYDGKWDSWYGPDGREGNYDVELVYNGLAGRAIQELGLMPDKEKIKELREAATVKCKEPASPIECKPLEAPCLFNIEEDPCEQRNLADKHPEVLQRLLKELNRLNATAVPPNNKPLDLNGDPKFWSRIFVNFGDYERSRTIEL
ncbi:arylsulfatase B [Galleria mellonella]|uniref:Arylsulfatase B n=1 Tax=Galleria mellonella TaxID=7137 RepID=A0A6J1X647_GALME|nr:arylsulfatase B [Galleria mellonella]